MIYILIIYVTFWILYGNLFVHELITNAITAVTGLMEILFSFYFLLVFFHFILLFLSSLWKLTKHFII